MGVELRMELEAANNAGNGRPLWSSLSAVAMGKSPPLGLFFLCFFLREYVAFSIILYTNNESRFEISKDCFFFFSFRESTHPSLSPWLSSLAVCDRLSSWSRVTSDRQQTAISQVDDCLQRHCRIFHDSLVFLSSPSLSLSLPLKYVSSTHDSNNVAQNGRLAVVTQRGCRDFHMRYLLLGANLAVQSGWW